MTNKNDPVDSTLLEQPFVSHLMELRDRLLRAVAVVAVVFLFLFPFANELYLFVAEPLMSQLPEGTNMVAIGIASPFLTPFKLSLVAAVFLSMPFILYQFWAFVAPGLYRHEKRLAMPVLASSIILFYLGMLFAYYLVFPLIFSFLTGVAPEGIPPTPDISYYLDFILTLFFAFGIAFEVPIVIIILVFMGFTTPDKLAEKRPYIFVGAFCIGMFLTPPDVISQTMLALPMWLLFELGLFFSRMIKKESNTEDESSNTPINPGPVPAAAGFTSAESAIKPSTTGGSNESAVPPMSGALTPEDFPKAIDGERFVPLTEEELDRELDLIEEEDDDNHPVQSEGAERSVDPIEKKLRQVQSLRDNADEAGARRLLYEVLAEGDEGQVNVARNILRQLDN